MSGQAHFEVYPRKTPPEGVPLDQTAAPIDYEGRPGPQAEYGWRLRAANGEIVAQSEGYTTKGDAERGAGGAWVAALSIGAAAGRMRGDGRDVPDLEVVES